MVAKALDKELNAASSGGGPSKTVVNDLSNAVRKKKRAPEIDGIQTTNSSKRKLEEDDSETADKKARLSS